MPGEFDDFAGGFTDVYAPALQSAITSQIAATGSAAGAMGVAFAAVAPFAIGLGIVKAIFGRRKRKRRRRRARRAARKKLAAARVTARGQARHVGVQGQQAGGQVVASGTQFGGTMAAGMSQAVMGNVFLQQQRILQGVGLDMTGRSKESKDRALKKEKQRKAMERRWQGPRGRRRSWIQQSAYEEQQRAKSDPYENPS